MYAPAEKVLSVAELIPVSGQVAADFAEYQVVAGLLPVVTAGAGQNLEMKMNTLC